MRVGRGEHFGGPQRANKSRSTLVSASPEDWTGGEDAARGSPRLRLLCLWVAGQGVQGLALGPPTFPFILPLGSVPTPVLWRAAQGDGTPTGPSLRFGHNFVLTGRAQGSMKCSPDGMARCHLAVLLLCSGRLCLSCFSEQPSLSNLSHLLVCSQAV